MDTIQVERFNMHVIMKQVMGYRSPKKGNEPNPDMKK